MNPFAIPVMFGLGGQLFTELSENETKTGQRSGFGMAGLYKTGGLGDALQCPGVDLESYEATCRAPIFRDMWNRWTLLRSTADGLTVAELEQSTKAFLGKLSAALDGKIRHVEVLQHGKHWPANVKLVNRLNVCGAPMTLRASEYAPAYYAVSARFVYRGTLSDIAWPARKVDYGFGSNCPVNADWLLDSVYAPSQVKVPDVSTDPILPPQYSDIPGELTPDLDFSTKVVLGGVGLLAVALAAGYAVRSFR